MILFCPFTITVLLKNLPDLELYGCSISFFTTGFREKGEYEHSL